MHSGRAQIVLRDPGGIANQEQAGSIGTIDKHTCIAGSMAGQGHEYDRTIAKKIVTRTEPFIRRASTVKKLYRVLTHQFTHESMIRLKQSQVCGFIFDPVDPQGHARNIRYTTD